MWSIKKITTFFSIIALTLVACTPEDGDTGAVGPVGPEGAIGPAGSDGKDGSSFLSMTYDVDSASWIMGGNNLSNSILVPEITTDVVSRGIVHLFQTLDNSVPENTVWRAVPYTDGLFSYSYSYETGRINLILTVTVNGSIPTLAAARNHTYRVLVVEPGAKVVGVNPKTYEEAVAVYGIED